MEMIVDILRNYNDISCIRDSLEYPVPVKIRLTNGDTISTDISIANIRDKLIDIDLSNQTRFFRPNSSYITKYNGYVNIYINTDNIESIKPDENDQEYTYLVLKGGWEIHIANDGISEINTPYIEKWLNDRNKNANI